MFLKPGQSTSVVETPGGDTYRVVDTAEGPRLWVAYTHKGYIDFTGEKTGVRLPPEIVKRLQERGVGPSTRFLSRAAAHRVLKEVGWTSSSGRRVGPSPFYAETPSHSEEGD